MANGPLLTAYIDIRARAQAAQALRADLTSFATDAARSAGVRAGDEFHRSFTAAAGSGLRSSGLGDEGQNAGEEAAAGAEEGLSGLKVAAGAIGAAAGAALTAGILTNLELDAAQQRLKAQLGATAGEAERFGQLTADLYFANTGDSIDQVSDSLVSLTQNLKGATAVSTQSLREIAPNFIAVGTAFDKEVGETSKSVASLLRNDLAPSAQQALDILTKGFQNGLNSADDLLDTTDEYGVIFKQLGLDGQEAFGLLQQGLQAGATNTDFLADALKELTIKASDGTAAAGFAAIGLNAVEMRKKITAGGDGAREALRAIFNGLNSIQDPARKSQAAIALFGTKAEDLQGSLYALDLDTAAAEFGQFAGAADGVNDALSDTAQAKISAYKRKLQELTAQAIDLGGPLGAAATLTVTFGSQALTAAGSLAQVWAALRIANLTTVQSTIATTASTDAIIANTAAREANALAAGTQATAAGAAGAAGTAGAAAGASRFLGRAGAIGLVGLLGYQAAMYSRQKDRQNDIKGNAGADSRLADLLSSGDTEKVAQAKKEFEALNSAFDGTVLGSKDVAAVMPQTAAALDALKASTEATKKATDDATTSAGQMADKYGLLTGSLSQQDAYSTYRAAIDAATAAAKSNSHELSLNSEAGRTNSATLRAIAESGVAYAEQLHKNGASEGEYRKQLRETRNKLIEAYLQFDNNIARAKEYADALLAVPPKVSTVIEAQFSTKGFSTYKEALDYQARHDPGSGRASGGPVQAGVPYVVGEQGQELFVPSTNGTIKTAAETKRLLGSLRDLSDARARVISQPPAQPAPVAAAGFDMEALAAVIAAAIRGELAGMYVRLSTGELVGAIGRQQGRS